jgi:hypothetical protein
MARYDHLPIYRSAFVFATEINKSVALFSRYHKYGIGEDLRRISYDILARIVRVNNSEDKMSLLLELRDHTEKAVILCRLAFELNAFSSIGNYEKVITPLSETSRQIE